MMSMILKVFLFNLKLISLSLHLLNKDDISILLVDYINILGSRLSSIFQKYTSLPSIDLSIECSKKVMQKSKKIKLGHLYKIEPLKDDKILHIPVIGLLNDKNVYTHLLPLDINFNEINTLLRQLRKNIYVVSLHANISSDPLGNLNKSVSDANIVNWIEHFQKMIVSSNNSSFIREIPIYSIHATSNLSIFSSEYQSTLSPKKRFVGIGDIGQRLTGSYQFQTTSARINQKILAQYMNAIEIKYVIVVAPDTSSDIYAGITFASLTTEIKKYLPSSHLHTYRYPAKEAETCENPLKFLSQYLTSCVESDINSLISTCRCSLSDIAICLVSSGPLDIGMLLWIDNLDPNLKEKMLKCKYFGTSDNLINSSIIGDITDLDTKLKKLAKTSTLLQFGGIKKSIVVDPFVFIDKHVSIPMINDNLIQHTDPLNVKYQKYYQYFTNSIYISSLRNNIIELATKYVTPFTGSYTPVNYKMTTSAPIEIKGNNVDTDISTVKDVYFATLAAVNSYLQPLKLQKENSDYKPDIRDCIYRQGIMTLNNGCWMLFNNQVQKCNFIVVVNTEKLLPFNRINVEHKTTDYIINNSDVHFVKATPNSLMLI
jgi:hypothetical protein